jgi:hypothetical protein
MIELADKGQLGLTRAETLPIRIFPSPSRLWIEPIHPMGHLDQLAKLTFAEEIEAITGGAVLWKPGPELGLTEVRLDGLFVVQNRPGSPRSDGLGPRPKPTRKSCSSKRCPATIWTTARGNELCSGGRLDKYNGWVGRTAHPLTGYRPRPVCSGSPGWWWVG